MRGGRAFLFPSERESRSVTYKLLAVDLDGTLLRHDGTIHPADRKAIASLQAAGVPVTIVTGRLYSGTRDVARAAGVRGPIGCVDGSHIVDTQAGASLVHETLAGDHAEVLREIVATHETATFLFTRDTIVHDGAGAPFAPYVRTWSQNVEVVDRVHAHPRWRHEEGITALVAVGAEVAIAAARDELRDRLAGVAHVVSFPVGRYERTFAMVVRAAGPTKGTAIAFLAAHHGCTPDEVVAVGDWLNDVPMFEVAGRSFVMAQAPEHVKAAATDRLEAHGSTGGGVAEAIARAWGPL